MKTSKLFLLIFVLTLCAPATFAQNQLKYVRQAVKGAKAAPYALNPALPSVVRTGLAVPVTRPNVSVAVERQVAAKVTVEERAARLEANLKKLEEYARTHNNRLPETFPRAEGSNFRRQVISDINFLKKRGVLTEGHPLVQRYARLVEVAQEASQIPQELIARLEKT